MTKIYYFLLSFLVFLLINNCQSKNQEKNTYFGGKIINPKSNHVVLYSMEQVIDTIYLNKKNKFIKKYNNLQEGLYYFIHGNENQYIYLEPNDSLMLRLNTWDFDESLVFAGKGAERNNMLIDCFLENEKDKKIFYSYNKLSPANFKNKVDSINLLKVKTYNDYIAAHPEETKGFYEILNVALTYPLYSRIEKYPILHAKYSKSESFPEIDKSFHDHRTLIEVNKDSLMYYPPYSQYIRNFLYHETYSLGHAPMNNEYTSKFTSDLLKVIDKEITSERAKNAFLRQTVISHFFNKSSCNINKEPFEEYFKLSSNDKDKELVQKLLDDTKAVKAQKKIQPFMLQNQSNAEVDIHHVIHNKKSLLLFWNPEYLSEQYISSRIKFLSRNYPKIEFILIKTDNDKTERIESLDIKTQFNLKESSKAHQFLTSKMPRAILVDDKGRVMNGYASISSNNLLPYLKRLNESK